MRSGGGLLPSVAAMTSFEPNSGPEQEDATAFLDEEIEEEESKGRLSHEQADALHAYTEQATGVGQWDEWSV